MEKKVKVVAVNLYGEVVPSVNGVPYYGEWCNPACKAELTKLINKARKIAAQFSGWVQLRDCGRVVSEYDLDGKMI